MNLTIMTTYWFFEEVEEVLSGDSNQWAVGAPLFSYSLGLQISFILLHYIGYVNTQTHSIIF